MLLADGFNDAVIGMGERAGQPPIVVYDFDKCVAILCERDNMSIDEAVDFMYYNVVGAWVGDTTPLFVKRVNNVEELYDVD
jgi:hypothetical protein